MIKGTQFKEDKNLNFFMIRYRALFSFRFQIFSIKSITHESVKTLGDLQVS